MELGNNETVLIIWQSAEVIDLAAVEDLLRHIMRRIIIPRVIARDYREKPLAHDYGSNVIALFALSFWWLYL